MGIIYISGISSINMEDKLRSAQLSSCCVISGIVLLTNTLQDPTIFVLIGPFDSRNSFGETLLMVVVTKATPTEFLGSGTRTSLHLFLCYQTCLRFRSFTTTTYVFVKPLIMYLG